LGRFRDQKKVEKNTCVLFSVCYLLSMTTKKADRKHTHRGTCQACGAVQAMMINGVLAKHGYTVDWGFLQRHSVKALKSLRSNTITR
jgi:hypothetical protein